MSSGVQGSSLVHGKLCLPVYFTSGPCNTKSCFVNRIVRESSASHIFDNPQGHWWLKCASGESPMTIAAVVTKGKADVRWVGECQDCSEVAY